MNGRITILDIAALNPTEIAITFSDQTTAIFNVEQLLALAPERIPEDSNNAGE